jgi:anti-sigma regulatory factor (Ser/Thr protein kinase)
VATVELRFTALPEHVRTARLVAVSLARRAGMDDETLDEVRLAVGEAATRAVGRHRASCPTEPVLVRLTDGEGRFVAEVVDVAQDDGISAAASVASEPDLAGHAEAEPRGVDALDEPLPDGIDLAVIGSLVDDVSVHTDSAGSVVRMVWPVQPNGSAGLVGGQAAFGTSPPSA